MIDIRPWLWFGLRLAVYSTILSVILLGLVFAFVLWYYWFVVRSRQRRAPQEKNDFQSRSVLFHTLSLDVAPNGSIALHLQVSPLEKQLIELAQLNGQQHRISSIDCTNERLQITFVNSEIQLTIEHEYLEQER